MAAFTRVDRFISFLLSFLLPLLSSGLTNADTVVNMRKVTHQTITEELSKTVLLPCLFTLRPSASSFQEPPRIKWTKVWGQRGSDGLQKEQSVLVAKDNLVKVHLLQVKYESLRWVLTVSIYCYQHPFFHIFR